MNIRGNLFARFSGELLCPKNCLLVNHTMLCSIDNFNLHAKSLPKNTLLPRELKIPLR